MDMLSQMVGSRYDGVSIRKAERLAPGLGLVGESVPDLTIVDIAVLGPGSDTGLARLVDMAAPQPVLAFDGRHHARNLEEARRAGARGYVTKTSSRELIEAAIALVAAGGSYFPQIEKGALPPSVHDGLSNRQLQVLEGLVQGKSNREIAEDLGIAVATVKLHVHAVLNATGARNRTEAAIKARDVFHGRS